MRVNQILLTKITLFVFLLSACKTETTKRENTTQDQNVSAQETKKTQFIGPAKNAKFQIGEKIALHVKLEGEGEEIICVSFHNEREVIAKDSVAPFDVEWDTKDSPVGNRNIKAEVKLKSGTTEYHRTKIILLPIESTIKYSYEIVKKYPHDIHAYTQGLVYEDGYFYEGTGEWGGKSSIRKVKLETGEVIRIHTMEPQFFGEGISVLNDEIYQVTYKKQIGFVYDKNDFKEIRQFNYSSNQGWGLTYDGENFIMSDGSYILHFMEPQYFSEVKRLEVFDNNGPVANLNELEYINGKIFANIYQTDNIVIIDAEKGNVLGKINMKGLLNKEDMHADIDVLNGIAYDKDNDRIFVTGKRWPKLFEVKFIEN